MVGLVPVAGWFDRVSHGTPEFTRTFIESNKEEKEEKEEKKKKKKKKKEEGGTSLRLRRHFISEGFWSSIHSRIETGLFNWWFC
jgi:hypothetical protein